jgi:hypothetical protein
MEMVHDPDEDVRPDSRWVERWTRWPLYIEVRIGVGSARFRVLPRIAEEDL